MRRPSTICCSGRFLVFLAAALAGEAVSQDRHRMQACVDSCTTALSAGAYEEANTQVEEALSIARELRDSSAIADVLVKRSSIRMMMGDFNNSLTDLQSALRIFQALGDEDGIATVYTSMGSIHYYDRNYTRAQQYYLKSLAIRERIGNRSEQAKLFGNIGSVLEEMGRPDSALNYHRMHLAIRQADDRKSWIPVCLSNIGVCFDKLGIVDSAVHYLEQSLSLYPVDGTQDHARGYALTMLGVARLHAGEPRKAIATCMEGLGLARAMADLPMQEQSYSCLYQAYHILGEPGRALDNYQRYVAVRDSISGEQRAKELIRIELTYHFESERLADSLRQVHERQQAEFAYQARLGKERDQKRIFLVSAIGVLLLSGGLWSRLRYVRRSRNIIQKERDRSEGLLLNILPRAIADELKQHGRAKAREVEGVSILFTDFHDFTRMSERLTAHELVAEIDTCYRAFDGIATRHGLEKIKTIGDAYMAAAGLPEPYPGSARGAVLAALDMQDWLKARALDHEARGLPFFSMRAGIHTGPVVAGIVGESKFQYDVWGDTVNTAAHMESAGEVGEVNVSEATFEQVKDDPLLTFSPRGRVHAKSKGELAMFFVRRATDRSISSTTSSTQPSPSAVPRTPIQ